MIVKKTFLPLVTLYSILGIILSTGKERLLSIVLLAILIILTYIIIQFRSSILLKEKSIIITCFFLCFVFFMLYSQICFSSMENDLKLLDRKMVSMEGSVTRFIGFEEEETKFILKGLSYFEYEIIAKKPNDIKVGDIYVVSGKLYKPVALSNNGQYDYLRSCYSKNISGTIYTKDTGIKKTGEKPLIKYLGNLRNLAIIRATEGISDVEKGIYTALITGSYELLDQNTKDIFRKSGLSHVLSISGTHFGILILPLAFIVSLIIKNKKIAFIIVMIIILSLLVFTGFKVSSVRAAICILTLMLCLCFFYDSNKYSIISIALLIILFLNPLAIYDTGLILSFGSVTSIVLFNDYITKGFNILIDKFKNIFNKKILSINAGLESFFRRLNKPYFKSLSKTILSAICLIISVQPAVIFLSYKLFHIVYPYSVLSNALTFAIIAPLLISIWLSIALPFIFTPVSSFFLKILINIAYNMSELPFSELYIKDIPNICFIIPLFVFTLISLNVISKKYSKILFGTFAMIVNIIIILISLTTKMVFIDVGQGDCALLSTFSGYNLLVDTGKQVDPSCIAWYSGQKLDAVLITHPDNDHCGGLFSLIDSLTVKKIYLPDTDNEKNVKFIDSIEQEYPEIEIELLKRGDCLKGKDFEIYVINPNPNEVYADINDASIVFNLKTKSCNILMTGDADLKKILNNKYLKCDIIKMPHHGDDKVFDKKSLLKTGAAIAIISVGKNNQYNHPKIETIKALNVLRIKYLRTDMDKSITLYLFPKRYMIFKYNSF